MMTPGRGVVGGLVFAAMVAFHLWAAAATDTHGSGASNRSVRAQGSGCAANCATAQTVVEKPAAGAASQQELPSTQAAPAASTTDLDAKISKIQDQLSSIENAVKEIKRLDESRPPPANRAAVPDDASADWFSLLAGAARPLVYAASLLFVVVFGLLILRISRSSMKAPQTTQPPMPPVATLPPQAGPDLREFMSRLSGLEQMLSKLHSRTDEASAAWSRVEAAHSATNNYMAQWFAHLADALPRSAAGPDTSASPELAAFIRDSKDNQREILSILRANTRAIALPSVAPAPTPPASDWKRQPQPLLAVPSTTNDRAFVAELLQSANEVLNRTTSQDTFRRRYNATWVTRSDDKLIATDREPNAQMADGFLLVQPGASRGNIKNGQGYLVPGLNFFDRRSALNDMRSVQRVFDGVFDVEEAPGDYLVAPVEVLVDRDQVTVQRKGVLHFAR